MAKRGFTLVEIMVCVVLSSIVLGTAYQIWTSARRDFSTASARQVLQHEIRMALEYMANDFKAAKRETLQTTNSGGQDVIKFQRFEEKMVAGKLDSTQTFEVTYAWDASTKILSRTAKGATKYLSTNIIAAKIEQNQGTPAPTTTTTTTPPAPPDAAALSQKARIDITLSGLKLITTTGKLASHTETVSIFMRDEFYGAVNKNTYVSITDLMEKKSDDLKVDDPNALLTLGALSKDQLRTMTPAELRDAEDKEKKCLEEMTASVADIDSQIKDVDTKGNRHLSTLFMKKSSEFTDEQKKLLDHENSKDLQDDKKRIEDKIKDREKKYIGTSMGSPGKTPDEFEQAAFDLKMKDWSIKKNWEESQKDKKESEKTAAPPSLLNTFNTSGFEKGVTTDANGNRTRFAETEAAFQSRKEYAEKVYTAAGKMDIDKLHQAEGEDNMKTYAAGKDLVDLANSKLSAVLRREQHEANIKTIQEVMAEKR